MCLVWAIIFRCLVWNRGMSVRDCLVRWGSQVRKNSLEIKCLRLWILTVTGQDHVIMAFNHQQASELFTLTHNGSASALAADVVLRAGPRRQLSWGFSNCLLYRKLASFTFWKATGRRLGMPRGPVTIFSVLSRPRERAGCWSG